MDTSKIREDLKQGKPVDVGALLDAIDLLTATKRDLNTKLAAALAEIDVLTKKIDELTKSNKLDEAYSVRSQEEREEKDSPKAKSRKGKKGDPKSKLGRKANQAKLAAAIRTESVYPTDVPPEHCILSHTRPIWRLEQNRAVIVAYEVWMHKPTKKYGKIPGVLGRSGFGIEFLLSAAFQVYTLGLSLDKVVQLTEFFQNLKLCKSQIDAMLNQLARHWESEFDNLCALVANSMIVHADETSWSIHSVWAFVSEQSRILLHGVHKDAATLQKILDPETFLGLVISDDAAVYSRFNKMQKCWAHLLRKSIRICLLDPENKKFEVLRDGLFEIFRSAKKLKADGRFRDDGRQDGVVDLQNRLYELIESECDLHQGKSYEGPLEEYRLLLLELLKLNCDDQLFTFVTTPSAVRPNGTVLEASGTNNESERTLRSAAMARKTDRASKTVSGARRRTVIVSTIESLRYFVPIFTLSSVICEIQSWIENGMSCFAKRLAERKDAMKPSGILGQLFPNPEPT